MTTSLAHDRVLMAVSKWNDAGMKEPTRDLVAMLSGYGTKKEMYKKILQQLKKLKLVRYPSSTTVAFTPKGRTKVSSTYDTGPPPSNAEVQDFIRQELLKPSMNIIFNYLLMTAGGGPQKRNDVQKATGYGNKIEGFKKTLQIMKKLKVSKVYMYSTAVLHTFQSFSHCKISTFLTNCIFFCCFFSKNFRSWSTLHTLPYSSLIWHSHLDVHQANAGCLE